MPTEFEYAMNLKARYEETKQEFKHPNITGNLLNLKNAYNLDYKKLKIEVEKLGYHIELAKDINNPYWQEQWILEPIFVFYKNQEDL